MQHKVSLFLGLNSCNNFNMCSLAISSFASFSLAFRNLLPDYNNLWPFILSPFIHLYQYHSCVYSFNHHSFIHEWEYVWRKFQNSHRQLCVTGAVLNQMGNIVPRIFSRRQMTIWKWLYEINTAEERFQETRDHFSYAHNFSLCIRYLHVFTGLACVAGV